MPTLTEKGEQRLRKLESLKQSGTKFTPEGEKHLIKLREFSAGITRQTNLAVSERPLPPRPELSLKEQFVMDIPETVGSILGGASGPLSAAGAGTASALKQAALFAIRSPHAPRTLGEFTGEVASEAGFGLVGGLAAKGLGKAAFHFRNPIARTIEKESKPFIDAIESRGGIVSLAQRTKSKIIDYLDNVARSGFFSSEIMRRVDAINQAIVGKNIFKEMVKTVAKPFTKLGDAEFGQMFSDVRKIGVEAQDATVKKLYGALDSFLESNKQFKILPNLSSIDISFPSTASLKKMALEFLPKASEGGAVIASQASDKTLKGILLMNDFIGFKSMHHARSAVMTLIRGASSEPDIQRGLGVLKKVAAMMTESMEEAAKRFAPKPRPRFGRITKKVLPQKEPTSEAFRLWNLANEFFKKGAEAFDNNFVVQLFSLDAKGTADKVADMIFRSDNAGNVKFVKNAIKRASEISSEVNFDAVWNQFKSKYLQDLLRQATPATDIAKSVLSGVDEMVGNVNFKTLLNTITNSKKRRTLVEVLGEEGAGLLEKFTRTGEFIIRKSKAGTGAFGLAQVAGTLTLTKAIFLGLPAVVVGLTPLGVVGGAVAGATGIFGLPVAMAKLLLNKTSIKLMTKQFTLKVGSPAWTKNAAKLSAKAIEVFTENPEIKRPERLTTNLPIQPRQR